MIFIFKFFYCDYNMILKCSCFNNKIFMMNFLDFRSWSFLSVCCCFIVLHYLCLNNRISPKTNKQQQEGVSIKATKPASQPKQEKSKPWSEMTKCNCYAWPDPIKQNPFPPQGVDSWQTVFKSSGFRLSSLPLPLPSSPLSLKFALCIYLIRVTFQVP